MKKKYSFDLDYSPLWIMTMKYNISKSELSRRCGINPGTVLRMTKNQPVHLSIIMKICRCFECKISDIVKIKHRDISFQPVVDAANMQMSYKGVDKLLEKYKISKNELCHRTGLSHLSLKKIEAGVPVHLSTIMRICECFECEIEDIVEVVSDEI